MDGRRGTAFARGGFCAFDRAGLVRLDESPDDVLPGDVEEALAADFVAAIGVAAEGDVVGLAPVAELGVPRLFHPPANGPAVILAVFLRVGLVVEPEGG